MYFCSTLFHVLSIHSRLIPASVLVIDFETILIFNDLHKLCSWLAIVHSGTYVCIPIGGIVTPDQRDRLEYIRTYIHNVPKCNTDLIRDVPWF